MGQSSSKSNNKHQKSPNGALNTSKKLPPLPLTPQQPSDKPKLMYPHFSASKVPTTNFSSYNKKSKKGLSTHSQKKSSSDSSSIWYGGAGAVADTSSGWGSGWGGGDSGGCDYSGGYTDSGGCGGGGDSGGGSGGCSGGGGD
ncbi:hypothetical protein DFS34DRAFT_695746 [Phlyctochytrium arcticum]|nr:hypothetical protein DFS34DRAFT_695746 [Phlyctochytrium arcticum]